MERLDDNVEIVIVDDCPEEDTLSKSVSRDDDCPQLTTISDVSVVVVVVTCISFSICTSTRAQRRRVKATLIFV